MAATTPKIRNVDEIKSALLQPALTSHYECYFQIPSLVDTFINQGGVAETSKIDLLMMSCSEATLPGSNLATHELNNDFTGVTQRHAYRRLYDDRADFTFYVNNKYSQILIFERWMQFISGEYYTESENLNNFYRIKYPTQYKTTIYITKFERTAESKTGKNVSNSTNGANYSGRPLYYNFYNAFPISIASMPVSYDSSQLLKCTVSFTYDRYVASDRAISGKQGEPGSPNTATGVPNPFNLTPEFQAAANAAYTQNLNFGNLSAATLTNPSVDPSILNAPLF